MIFTAIIAAWTALGIGRMPFVWAVMSKTVRRERPELFVRTGCAGCDRKRAQIRWRTYLVATLVLLPLAALSGPIGWLAGREP